MNKPIILLLAGACLGLPVRGAVPPPEKLLPSDTVLVVTAPDWGKAWTFLTNSSYGRMFQDPAIRAFRDKSMDKFTADILTPAEKNFNFKLSDFQGLAQGQVTFAVVPAGQKDNPKFHFSQLLLVDTKDHSGQLKTNLAAIQKKWADAGRPMKTQKMRDVEFTTLIVSPDDLTWRKMFQQDKPADADADADASAKSAEKNVELTFGQSDSLLIVGESTEVIEKVLSRQEGGLVPPLGEQADFQADYAARLRNSPIYAWVNTRALMDVLAKPPTDAGDGTAALLKFNGLAGALGLQDLTSVSVSWQSSPDGLAAEVFVRAPGERHGLPKILAPDAKDSSPPPFVPADAVKFWRWRVNIPHSWALLEATLNDVNPTLVTGLNSILQMAGKDKDANYDLKAELLGNLGDDVLSYEESAKDHTLAGLKSAPALVLVGSPNAEKLATTVKVGLGVIARGQGGIKDREFLGRTIYTMTSPAPPGGKAAGQNFNFCGSGGYLAMSTDAGILEEYLRSNDSKAKALADTRGLADAAQKVGGTASGWFGLENQNVNMRTLFDVLRNQNVTLSDILGTSQAMGGVGSSDVASKFRDWVDFSLLPPYDAVSKYFHYSVYAGTFSPDGFSLKIFAPTPPQLR